MHWSNGEEIPDSLGPPGSQERNMTSPRSIVETFVGLADTLIAEFDTIGYLHNLVERYVELLGVSSAGLMLADQRGTLQLLASSDEDLRALELLELQTDQGPCMDSYRTGQAVINVSATEAAERWPDFYPSVVAGGFLTVHALPLRLRHEVIGAINLFRADEEPLSAEAVMLGKGLADMATIGLMQHRTIREQQVLSEQLQFALNSRVLIEQAKGVLAERYALSMRAAFEALRSHARNHGARLSAVAEEVLEGSAEIIRPVG